jgi:hypothetical protein
MLRQIKCGGRASGMISMLSSLANAAMFDTAPFQRPPYDAVYQVDFTSDHFH